MVSDMLYDGSHTSHMMEYNGGLGLTPSEGGGGYGAHQMMHPGTLPFRLPPTYRECGTLHLSLPHLCSVPQILGADQWFLLILFLLLSILLLLICHPSHHNVKNSTPLSGIYLHPPFLSLVTATSPRIPSPAMPVPQLDPEARGQGTSFLPTISLFFSSLSFPCRPANMLH